MRLARLGHIDPDRAALPTLPVRDHNTKSISLLVLQSTTPTDNGTTY